MTESASPLDLENLKSGARWRGLYQMGELLPDVTYGRIFKAQHVGLMTDVIIRVFKVCDDTRARTCEAIRNAQNGGLVEFVEAVESDGRRVEIMQAAPAVTLREWIGRKNNNPAELVLIVKQLAHILGNLHQHGVVHLNVRPSTVYVRTTDGGLAVFLGGFDMAQLLEGVEGHISGPGRKGLRLNAL